MPSMTKIKCANCNNTFEARTADVNRGWGKFCSKSCKASKQTKLTGITGPHYKAAGRTVEQMQNGNYAKSKFKDKKRWFRSSIAFEPWDEEVENGDAKYSHKHGCWLVRDNGDDPFIDAHPFDSDAAGFNNA